jgi:hypothetical protein
LKPDTVVTTPGRSVSFWSPIQLRVAKVTHRLIS